MVVTLNPSPEYAHETKHVLSLAAVAQDIRKYIFTLNLNILIRTNKQFSSIVVVFFIVLSSNFYISHHHDCYREFS